MKDILHKTLSLFLAFLVLGSTMSFSIDKHFCGEHLVDVAFFGDAEPCAMEKALETKYGSEHDKKIDCCSDELVVVEGQDELKIQFDQLTIENVTFLTTFSHSYIDLFKGLEQEQVPFDGYPPPLISTDFQLLYEQFLI